jgi:hypothetical protein
MNALNFEFADEHVSLPERERLSVDAARGGTRGAWHDVS